MPRFGSHHLHWQFEFDKTPTMRWIFVMRFLRDFVGHLTTFFVPIHIYQQAVAGVFLPFLPGGELQRGMTAIGIYFLVYRLVTLIATIPFASTAKKIGHVTLLLLSHLFFIVYLVSLFGGRWYPWLLLVAAVFEGLGVSTFWPNYQTIMANAVTTKYIGKDLGVLQFILRLTTLMSPAIGGAIIMAYGFPAVCLIGVVGVVLSVMTTAQIKVEPEKDKVSWKEFKQWFSEKVFAKLALTYLGRYINDAVLVLWPVYVFIILGSVERVGFLYSFSLFFALLITFIAGMYIDHTRTRTPFLASGVALSLLWLARIQIWSFWQIAVVNTIEKLLADFHWLVYDAHFFKRGQGSQAYSFFVYREVIMSVSALAFWLLVIGLFSALSSGWMSVFVLAAVGVLASVYIQDTHH